MDLYKQLLNQAEYCLAAVVAEAENPAVALRSIYSKLITQLIEQLPCSPVPIHKSFILSKSSNRKNKHIESKFSYILKIKRAVNIYKKQ